MQQLAAPWLHEGGDRKIWEWVLLHLGVFDDLHMPVALRVLESVARDAKSHAAGEVLAWLEKVCGRPCIQDTDCQLHDWGEWRRSCFSSNMFLARVSRDSGNPRSHCSCHCFGIRERTWSCREEVVDSRKSHGGIASSPTLPRARATLVPVQPSRPVAPRSFKKQEDHEWAFSKLPGHRAV